MKPTEDKSSSESITCPFCNENGFDKIGLKYHFDMGYCKEYSDTLTIQEEGELRKIKNQTNNPR